MPRHVQVCIGMAIRKGVHSKLSKIANSKNRHHKTASVIPTLASGKHDVESRLGGGKSHRGGGAGDGAANNVGGTIGNTDDINEEVLAREVCGVGPNEKSCSTSNDGRQTHIGLAVLVSGLLDVLEGAGEDRSGGAKAKVEGGTATKPSSGKYLVMMKNEKDGRTIVGRHGGKIRHFSIFRENRMIAESLVLPEN